MHHAYAVTGAISTAAAAVIPGTIVNQACEEVNEVIKIGHQKGIIDVKIKARPYGESVEIESISIGRTARRLMAGIAYYIE